MDFSAIPLPEGWDRTPLHKMFEFTKRPRGVAMPPTVPYLTMEQLPVDALTVEAYDERPGTSATSGTYVENGDLLVAKITPSFENGKQGILSWDRPFGMATTEVHALHGIAGVSCSEFLFHLLLIDEVRDALARRMDSARWSFPSPLSPRKRGSPLCSAPPTGRLKR
jgi:type I restriction enzyme S subunit